MIYMYETVVKNKKIAYITSDTDIDELLNFAHRINFDDPQLLRPLDLPTHIMVFGYKRRLATQRGAMIVDLNTFNKKGKLMA